MIKDGLFRPHRPFESQLVYKQILEQPNMDNQQSIFQSKCFTGREDYRLRLCLD
jgi:hypothetical protein